MAAQHLRSRVLGGGRPLLDSLSANEMAAANDMLLKGQAEITCHSCRLFLTATVKDDPIPMDGLRQAFRRLARLRGEFRRVRATRQPR